MKHRVAGHASLFGLLVTVSGQAPEFPSSQEDLCNLFPASQWAADNSNWPLTLRDPGQLPARLSSKSRLVTMLTASPNSIYRSSYLQCNFLPGKSGPGRRLPKLSQQPQLPRYGLDARHRW
jgi:hypothetical protein